MVDTKFTRYLKSDLLTTLAILHINKYGVIQYEYTREEMY